MSEEISPIRMEQGAGFPAQTISLAQTSQGVVADDVAVDHLQTATAAAAAAAVLCTGVAAPPSSEMMNLPPDFLSLRHQEPSPLAVHSCAPTPQHPKPTTNCTSKYEAQDPANSTLPTKVGPLIPVHMAPSQPSPLSAQSRKIKTALPSCMYPQAHASHDEVCRDKDLFTDTLRRLHGTLGNKSFTIPTIGGSQLDLHLLYREVTARGGLEQVIKDRIWKEIKAVFHFPPTTTNASYVLRKCYTNLLHHYEQVYFHKNQGSLVKPPVPGDPPSVEIGSDDSEGKRKRKRNLDKEVSLGARAATCIGETVTGAIEGKFEHGYLVTVTVGNENMKGVLYNVPPGEHVPQFAMTTPLLPKVSNGNQCQALVAADGEVRHTKRRRRLGLRKKDPNAPKLNRSAYNFFFAEQRARIRLLQPNREISRMIGDSWNKLSDEQRMPYKERGLVDKERYRKEIRLYREGVKKITESNGSIDIAVTPTAAAVAAVAAVDDEEDDDGDDDDGDDPVALATAAAAVAAAHDLEENDTKNINTTLNSNRESTDRNHHHHQMHEMLQFKV